MIAGNMKGDFSVLHKAYGGEVKIERLKASWTESMKGIEKDHGRILRHEILGTARTQDRDETVVRFICEKGRVDMTYVWDIEKEGRLQGRSVRGLRVRQRLMPSGEEDFFTWDGGIRPPKMVRIERGADGKLRLTVAGSATPASVCIRRPASWVKP